MRCSILLVLSLLTLLPLAVHPAPPRTFVASTGLDSNPCSLVAPCRTFATAVGALPGGGEVVVLDSAGYGEVTITNSVSIVAPPGVYAGVTAYSFSAIIVNGPGIVVTLRGLTVVNQAGGIGIDFRQGVVLHVENCVISGFGGAAGIVVNAPYGRTYVVDSIVRDNGVGIAVNGIMVAVNISRTRLERNWNDGILIQGAGGDAVVAIEDSVVSGSGHGIELFPTTPAVNARVAVARTLISDGSYGIVARPGPLPAVAQVTVMDSTITNMTAAGIYVQPFGGKPTVTAIRNQLQGNAIALSADGSGATLILDGNAVTGNGTGVERANGATIVSRSNNTVTANGVDTIGTPYTSLPGI